MTKIKMIFLKNETCELFVVIQQIIKKNKSFILAIGD